jgi:protein TonB
MLVKKQVPIYPQDAKDAHVSGTVVLQATIGSDGRIHDLRVVSAPWPSLAASSLWAVLHWEYKPYMLNGEPVEVQTTVNVIYTLGQ